jgi:hypothetical protein
MTASLNFSHVMVRKITVVMNTENANPTAAASVGVAAPD